MPSTRATSWAIAAFASTALVGAALLWQEGRADEAGRRQAAAGVAARAALSLQQQIAGSLSATAAIAAVIRQHGEVEDFEPMAAELLRTYRGLANLQLAPGGVVRRIHPLAGNEGALGHDLFADPARRADAEATVRSRSLTMAGPFPLRQGGVGMVGRLPVFVPQRDGERFWGFVNALLKLPEVLAESRLDRLEAEGWAWSLSRATPGGEEAIAGHGRLDQAPVAFSVDVPNARWTLRLTPAGGWRPAGGHLVGWGVTLAAALAIAAGAFALARQPERLRRQVAERTEALAAANRRLQDELAERHRVEEQLVHAQKMEAVGQLAGGVAHDFNNLLTAILAHAGALAEEAAPGSEAAESARTIEQAARRAAELTRQLLGFARRGKLLAAPTDLHLVLGEVARLLGRTLDKRIVVAQKLGATHPVVLGDAGQLQQAVLNLAVNARDAMPDGGVLTFETALREVEPAARAVRPGLAPGPFVVLTVRDSGQGVPAAIRDRIFEPFFTTKEAGRGTGMGLAMVYGIVANHGGLVTLESAEGQGAAFSLWLPAHRALPEATRPLPPAAAPAGPADGTILVVDDEPLVLETSRRLLAGLGYRVVALAGGAQAVAWVHGGGRADLAILDLAMPEMDGAATFEALRRLAPALRVLVSSGYERDGRVQALLDRGAVGFLAKPWRREELAAEVARALAAG